MKYPYVIFSDISADILPDFIEENDIHIIPMRYTIGGEERICTNIEDEVILKRFYDGQRNGDMTQTTQIPPQQYIEAFMPLIREGKSILYLSLSGGLSNTYTSALMASNELMEQFPDAEIICVDTLAATGGMGILLEAAVQNRNNGMTIKENAEWLETNRLRVCHWFMVEDLMYLKRGGRVSASTAVLGTALNIKPILKIENDGTLISFAKKRGTKAALKHLVDLYSAASYKEKNERIYIVHADSEENADYLEREVRTVNPECSIVKMMLSPIIGAHTGPGMCAIIHFGKSR